MPSVVLDTQGDSSVSRGDRPGCRPQVAKFPRTLACWVHLVVAPQEAPLWAG